jgi:hypothetical protein
VEVVAQRVPVAAAARERVEVRLGVQHEVEGRVAEPEPDAQQRVLQRLRQRLRLVARELREAEAVVARRDHELEGEARRVGRERDEAPLVPHDAAAVLPLELEQVAEEAALLSLEVLAERLELAADADRVDRRRDDLAVRVVEGRARRRPAVLEDQHVLEPRVAVEVDQAVAPARHHVADLRDVEVGEIALVLGRLHHHLVRPHAPHRVVGPLRALVRRPFHGERRELVGEDAHAPARPVGVAARLAQREDLRRRERLVRRAERAGVDRLHGARHLAERAARPPCALRRDDDPALVERVAT